MAEFIDPFQWEGKIVYIPDTPENRARRSWYFEREFHHYTYNAHEIYKYGKDKEGNQRYLCHTYMRDVIEGMERNSAIESDALDGDRFNIPLEVLELYQGSNKDMVYVLSKFSLED
jgi:hypothetical protein